jgi:glycosyltransferase involved in cell wall biosynthesis
MSSPRVAINARAAVRREIGGVERLAREMVTRLPRLNPSRYRVVRPPEALAHRAGHAWEQALLPLIARESQFIYSPANLAPLASRRNVVVIHDVAALRHPEWYRPLYVTYQRGMLPALARRARLVLTVSEFSKRELVEVLGANADRVAVVPNGVDERFTPEADPGPARAAHGLEQPYVLVVGTRIARKNLGVMALAAARLREQGVEVVHAGSGRDYMRGEQTDGLRPLGYVHEDHLPGLYAGALALAMPSLYEGFGLPCLEAMACGVPVVASNRGALPETCAPAGLLVEPDDQEGFAAELERLVADDAYRGRIAGASLEHARGFTWERTAKQTDALIEHVM